MIKYGMNIEIETSFWIEEIMTNNIEERKLISVVFKLLNGIILLSPVIKCIYFPLDIGSKLTGLLVQSTFSFGSFGN